MKKRVMCMSAMVYELESVWHMRGQTVRGDLAVGGFGDFFEIVLNQMSNFLPRSLTPPPLLFSAYLCAR